MNKTETIAAVVKAAYVRPRIACYAAASESSLCAGSPIGGGAGTAHSDPEVLGEEEDEDEDEGNS